ncbi:uncharacterized protein LOC123654335 [Melitaea cinxia]|uniref:uncharacterized protein LOC123654335 n=1 Tax=Melitaea cinxia TaxID=113334 RepID=UPI001E270D9A|nr:uncharacterized protein LOC123654335 [Melitaea cinxia]
MNFTYLCLVILQSVLLSDIYALYNKDVICTIDKNNFSICKTLNTPSRRRNINVNIPSHEPYLPTAKNGLFYNCSSQECNPLKVYSISQIALPGSHVKYCYLQTPENYKCESLKYNYYKNIDKLLFLSNNIPDKLFYLIDCLAYSDGGRVCHKKDEVESYTKLVDIGNIARPNDTNVLSQEEFICEQTQDKTITCDLNRYVPYNDGLKPKDVVKFDDKILLKTGSSVATLSLTCFDSWCGYNGVITPSRRVDRYEPPGGKVYRCYYANKQQICKEIYGRSRSIYNDRDWLSS